MNLFSYIVYVLVFYRDEAEKEFLECSEVAKAEIKAFHNKRLAEFRQAMLYYVEVIMRGIMSENSYL